MAEDGPNAQAATPPAITPPRSTTPPRFELTSREPTPPRSSTPVAVLGTTVLDEGEAMDVPRSDIAEAVDGASLEASDAAAEAPMESGEARATTSEAFSIPASAATSTVSDDDAEGIDLGLTDEDLALDDVLPPAAAPAEVDEPAEVILGEIVDSGEAGPPAGVAGEALAARMATPLGTMRVPAIPEANLSVAAAIESVARRLRAGEVVIAAVQLPETDEAALALALSAVLGIRH